DVQAHLVRRRLDVIYFVRFQEDHAPSGLYDQAVEIARARMHFLKERAQAFLQFQVSALRDLLLRALDSLAKALLVKWLQQVIEGIGFEGPDGVLVERSSEDHRRHFFRADSLEHAETVHIGHFDVKEEEVWAARTHQRDGFGTVAGLAYDLDGRLIFQERADAFTRERLIVGDQGADGHFTPRNALDEATGIGLAAAKFLFAICS